ncbi:unnamed protein product [Arabidopsis lyrata]|nr:unnamed protein product [Arabidopsis lyrata]
MIQVRNFLLTVELTIAISLHLERFKDACSSKNYSTCREVLSRLKDIIDEKEAQEGLTLPQTHDETEDNEHVEEPQDFDNNEQEQIGDQLDFDNNEQQQIGDQLDFDNNEQQQIGDQLDFDNNEQQQIGDFFDGIPEEENDLEDHLGFSKLPLDDNYLKQNPWGYFTTVKTSEELQKNQKRGGAKAQKKRGGAKAQQKRGGEKSQQQLNEEPLRRSERRPTPTKRLLESLGQRDSEEEEE